MKILLNKKILSLISIVAFGIVIAVLSPVLSADFFCWDDKTVALSPLVRILNFRQLIYIFSEFHAGLYHPITTLSFAIDYTIGNGHAFEFHLTNFIIHIINIILVFQLSFKLTKSKACAFGIALFFGILPINVEVVAWITSRKDSIYTMFFLAGLILYSEYLTKGGKGYYIIVFILFLFSSLSKIQAVTFPLILLSIDYLHNRRMLNRKVILEKIPFFILAILIIFINLQAQKSYGYINYGGKYSLFKQIITFSTGFNHYILNIIFPFNISVFYPFPFSPGADIPVFYLLQPLILILYLIMLGYFILKGKRIHVFGAFFFFVTISVTLLIQNHRDAIIADRYGYLASLGILILISVFLLKLSQRIPKLKWIVAGIMVMYFLIFGYITFVQSTLWQSPSQLMEASLKHYPDTPIILNTLATEEIKKEDFHEALSNLNTAIRIDPGFTDALYNRGIVNDRLQDFENALKDFTVCINSNPYYTDAYFGRGNIFRQMGNTDNAIKDFSTVIRLDKNNAGAWNNRAIVKGQQGNFSGAISDLDVAIEIQNDLAPAYYLRGVAKFKVGLNGCDDLHKAVSLNYTNAEKALQFYCGR